MVGKSIAKRYPGAQMGKKLRFGRGEWEVVGVMDGGQSSVNSEIFGDLNQVSSDFNRADGLSSVLLRATDAATVPALINSLNDDRRLAVLAETEKSYYEAQTNSGALLQFLGIFIAIIMAVGSSFAAMNTMYAAVARRATEIGTLRVLGFSKNSIMLSFLFESLLLAGLGGLHWLPAGAAAQQHHHRHRQFCHVQRNRFQLPRQPRDHAGWNYFCPCNGSGWRTLPGQNGRAEKKSWWRCGRFNNMPTTELKNLQIDRGKRRTHEPSPWAVRWIVAGVAIFILLGAARFIYAKLTEATEVEVVRVHAAAPADARRRKCHPERHRLHRRRPQD